MWFGRLTIGLIAVAALGLGAMVVLPVVERKGGNTGWLGPLTPDQFCSVVQTNGSELVDLARIGQPGTNDATPIADEYALLAPPPIQHEMKIVRDGIKLQPEHPTAQTIAAAARVDAFMLRSCGSQSRA